MRILLVDDDALVRRELERVLRQRGHDVCWSATGEGALLLLRSEQPDVMILDMKLGPGGMSGWDVAREQRLDPTTRAIPIIVLSGMAPADVRAGAHAVEDALAGSILILGKPCDVDLLDRALAVLAESLLPTRLGG
jgi:CheY-like chemotaxis protein